MCIINEELGLRITAVEGDGSWRSRVGSFIHRGDGRGHGEEMTVEMSGLQACALESDRGIVTGQRHSPKRTWSLESYPRTLVPSSVSSSQWHTIPASCAFSPWNCRVCLLKSTDRYLNPSPNVLYSPHFLGYWTSAFSLRRDLVTGAWDLTILESHVDIWPQNGHLKGKS